MIRSGLAIVGLAAGFVGVSLLGSSKVDAAGDLQGDAPKQGVNDAQVALEQVLQNYFTLAPGAGSVAQMTAMPELPERAFNTTLDLGDETLNLQIVPHSVRSPKFKVITELNGVYTEVEPEAERTVRGTIEGVPGAVLAGSLTTDGLRAIVYFEDDDERLVIEPVRSVVPGRDRGTHFVYNASDVLDSGAICGTGVMLEMPRDEEIPADYASRLGLPCGGQICEAEIALEIDGEYRNQYDGFGNMNTAQTLAQTSSIINGLNVQYERDVQITHVITSVIVRLDATTDPYTTNDAGALLNQFTNTWNSPPENAEPRDIAHMFTGRTLAGSTIGIAWLGQICDPASPGGLGYGLVEDFGGFNSQTDLSAHELGHNWSAVHCSCSNPAFTMNPSITNANRFSQGTINQISAHRDSRGCLSASESAFTSLPISDMFPSTLLDTTQWTGNDGTTINTIALNEPSPPNSLNLDGTDELRSAFVNASLVDDITVTYWWQRGGGAGGNTPEVNEDLVVEFLDAGENWIEVDRQFGGGSDSVFTQETVILPDAAEHANLRVRFRATSGNTGADDWFLDDLSVTATQLAPGVFTLNLPLNGSDEVSINPFFDWDNSLGAIEYTFTIDDDSDFSSPIVSLTTPNSFFSGFLNLPQCTEFFWKVVADNAAGQTDSSPVVASFTTGANCVAACPGDVDGSGSTDVSDITLVVSNLGAGMAGAVGTPGDANGDGLTTTSDITFVVANLGCSND
ncbi:MAG: M12 family metallo-peptidase [Planctomycetota bacterium]